ncbi:hypothetical protein [Qipengyuania oceanensis]|uniref:Fimbria/pilus outer membrane usher protein n=1 Tax=Qipengyuania oceanensis TaxID=1463597 RepID=A0A844YJD7_9SPHN|nr:hypothetical protein [Qipengyuania oceanensis]MXO63439.1 hypothetical protein [Qipengyuania oceanensis]
MSLIALGAPAAAHQALRTISQDDEAGISSDQSERIVTFSVPLVTESRAFGDVLIETTVTGRQVRIRSSDLTRELSEILNQEGRTALDQAVAGREFVTPGDLEDAGFTMTFDPGQLQLVVEAIEPRFRVTRQLLEREEFSARNTLPVISPARFSSYLNLIGNLDYDTRNGSDAPDVFFSGATRVGRVVAEYEGAFTDQFSQAYRFYRRNARLVYDDPASYRRYSAGDLRLEALSIMAAPTLGGISVQKRRRIFDPSFTAARLSGRQIFLDNRSTVEVRVNGDVYETLQLDAGQYDLANLPMQQGSNDIELVITDSFGQQQIIPFDLFYETLDLAPGEEEYSIGAGFISENFGFEPQYGSEIGASGFYRKALSENLVVGGAAQASQDLQLIGASVIAVPQFVPGVVEAEAATSRADDAFGAALRLGYRFTVGRQIYGPDQVALTFDYKSADFRSLTEPAVAGFDVLSATVSYSRSFGWETIATAGASYFRSGGGFPASYAAFVDVTHRLSDTLRGSLGVEYGGGANSQRGIGIRAGITATLGKRTRASADYRSRLNSLRANISRGAENHVGSFGYDFGVTRSRDDTQSTLQLEYEANRFNARADFATGGGGLAGVFDEQRARLQVATSYAFADGVFGMGRPVNNAFVLAKPNSAIRGQEIVTGRSIREGYYYARSGPFGAALQGDLAAYSRQNVDFDGADPEKPFDVGDGTVLVDPPYKGGYSVIAGDENYLTVLGTLNDANGPVSAVAGEVVDEETGERVEDVTFFTNSAGRFGLFGVAPNKRYIVRLNGSGRTFTIVTPDSEETILRLAPITIPAE